MRPPEARIFSRALYTCDKPLLTRSLSTVLHTRHVFVADGELTNGSMPPHIPSRIHITPDKIAKKMSSKNNKVPQYSP